MILIFDFCTSIFKRSSFFRPHFQKIKLKIKAGPRIFARLFLNFLDHVDIFCQALFFIFFDHNFFTKLFTFFMISLSLSQVKLKSNTPTSKNQRSRKSSTLKQKPKSHPLHSTPFLLYIKLYNKT